jgi:pimeloyl-ACP methyl ester carboxylesterase
MTAVDEGLFLPVGGIDQWVTIRGADRANPVLMILPGPGAGFSAMAPLFASWEARFTVVQWDQPGAGATAAKAQSDPQALTYDRLVRDGLVVAQAALAWLGQEKLVLFAFSGGTVAGLRMIRTRPELFSAYVANGQVTNWARQEALSYWMILERARAGGDAGAAAEIQGIGPPPWTDVSADVIRGKHANAMTAAEQAAFAAAAPALRSPPAGARYLSHGLQPSDPYATGLAAFAALKPELAAFDADALGLEFATPMVFLQGAQDAHLPTSEVEAYAAKLRAPSVVFETIEEGGHMSMFLAERLLALLEKHVRPLV